ncbi:MAG TPA: metallophosphoesterase [Ktedonobacterales bacterium]|nr:metallophosphoesterase [Ktedonobacterales bacterium]
MRYAIFSDVHGNDEALRAVFSDIDAIGRQPGGRVDQIWCLGDIVGYGPEPSECVRWIRQRVDVCIPGNHDWAAVGKINLDEFSGAAAESAEWTRDHLRPDERVFLRALPDRSHIGDFTLVHGSPSNPIWEYLITPAGAAPNFAAFDTLFCVVGHTHLPTIFLQPTTEKGLMYAALQRRRPRPQFLAMATPGGPSWNTMEHEAVELFGGKEWARCERLMPGPGLWMLPHGYRAIINPGSVGQPRDGDPRASYVIYDSAVGFEFRRVPYDIGATQRKIHARGLSARLAERLSKGL